MLTGSTQGVSAVVFPPGLQFMPLLYGAKAFVWPDRMLADPTNAVIGGDNSQARSPRGVEVK